MRWRAEISATARSSPDGMTPVGIGGAIGGDAPENLAKIEPPVEARNQFGELAGFLARRRGA